MKPSLSRIAILTAVFFITCALIHLSISDQIEAEFTKRNITFQSKKRSLLGLNYYQLKWKNNIAQRVHIPFSYPIRIAIFDAHIMLGDTKDSIMSPPKKQPFPISVEVYTENISISHPMLPIQIEALSGTLFPRLSLQSSHLSIEQKESFTQLKGSLPHPMDGEAISITLKKTNKNVEFTATIPTFPIKHPRLSNTSVTIPKSKFHGSISDSILDGSIRFLDSHINLQGPISLENKKVNLNYDGAISLETLHTLFPLSTTLSLQGSFLANGTIQWPQKTWTMRIDCDEFTASGTLFDPLPLKYGSFTHTSPSTLKTHISGSTTPNWSTYEKLGWLAKTAVASEDASFWTHKGYSISSIQEAIDDYQVKNKIRGGSTITQQLAKNLFLSSERTIERKVHEFIYTLFLEQSLTKKEILTTYLNIVEFGPEIHGVSQAAKLYFLKKPRSLTLVEASYLASILPAPTRFFTLAQKSKRIPRKRTDRVLVNLLDSKEITKQEYSSAIGSILRVLPPIE